MNASPWLLACIASASLLAFSAPLAAAGFQIDQTVTAGPESCRVQATFPATIDIRNPANSLTSHETCTIDDGLAVCHVDGLQHRCENQ